MGNNNNNNDDDNMMVFNQGDDSVDVLSEIKVNYSYNRHQKRGYHCAYTEGMEKYGCPELCLMDYYPPDEAQFILLNMADCVLNGDIFDRETGEYDFLGIVELVDDSDGSTYRFGFIGGWLYEQEGMCLQLLGEDDYPLHPGGDSLQSLYKRGFEPWPTFMYVGEEDE